MRHAVVFPGIPTPLGVSRPLSQRAIQTAHRSRGFLFAVAQRTPVLEPEGDDLFEVGVIARLLEVKQGTGDWEVLLHGMSRARALTYTQEDGHLCAVVDPIFETLPDDLELPSFVAVQREIRDRVLELGQLRGVPQDVLQEVLSSLTEPSSLVDFVGSYVEVPTYSKQALLETFDVSQRMSDVLVHLNRQIQVERTRDEIRNKVHDELGTRQREIFLREQIRVIREELGDDEGGDVDSLFERLSSMSLPEQVQREVQRESRRLRRANLETGEAQVIRTYLEWIAEMPWSARSEDCLDLQHAQRILDEDHHGLTQVKERVLEFLAVRSLRASELRLASQDGSDASRALGRGPILLFVGPPGVGKTSIARSIARALGRSYTRIALGGVHDESDIRGHRRTYIGAMPGRIVEGMKHAGTKNPVFVLDEIDKLGSSWHGNPSNALLEVLDPAQNDSFTDHYLNVPFDLSEVLFVATANLVEPIPPALLDRMEVVTFEGYSETDKIAIGREFLLPRALLESGLSSSAPLIEDEAIRAIVRERTRESGVRQLEREICALLRKLARKLAAGEAIPMRIRATEMRALLGRPKVRSERALRHDEIGTATGMYYTPSGGDIMFVEAAVRPLGGEGSELGEVSLVLTGHLGEVMKESARAAVTVATRRAVSWGVLPKLQGPLEAHIHVPAGAVPKDGPSAGLAIAVALVSALSGHPVRRDVAITGEITLSGRVLPVGGLEEKLLGAERAGIRHVVIPEENVDDLERLSEEVLSRLQLHPVESVDEALNVALSGARADANRWPALGPTAWPGRPVASDRPL